MLFHDISYINEDQTLREHMQIGVEGCRIAAIEPAQPLTAAAARWGRVIPGQGRLLLPGFYNAHSHAAMTLLRGYGENMALDEWLYKLIFPFEDHLTYSDIYWGTMLSCLEMLRYGIVSTTDMYMNGPALGDGFRDGGVKANFSVCVTGFDDAPYQGRPQYAAALAALDEYHGLDEGRLQLDSSLHAEYTSREPLVRSLAAFAQEKGLRMQVHVSETSAEVAECQERHQGRSPVAYLADCGLFDGPATAAHCVHLSPADINILKEKGVSVATCPKSNLKLASGVAPVPQLLSAGVNVALATDSVSSNNSLNMLEEARLYSLLHKGISGDPTLISPAQALYAASRAGALSQGRADCGAIAVGNRADLALLDVTGPYWRPCHDMLNNLLYAGDGADVVMTLVDGKIRYENGDWPGLDAEKIYAEAESSRQRILAELAAER